MHLNFLSLRTEAEHQLRLQDYHMCFSFEMN